ncbi:hypothetical protein DPV78_002429 [Talaromyces pinophilus]|nr:hypothetical protein DPV78_002429 [Talaromyces pinophilus]
MSVDPFSDPSGLIESVYFIYRYGSSPFVHERHSLPALMGMGQGKVAAIEGREYVRNGANGRARSRQAKAGESRRMTDVSAVFRPVYGDGSWVTM